jgi:hypothetical protein
MNSAIAMQLINASSNSEAISVKPRAFRFVLFMAYSPYIQILVRVVHTQLWRLRPISFRRISINIALKSSNFGR